MTKIAIKIRAYGHVQGVWYRGFVAEKAKGLSITGWVRNRVDDTVEALLIGQQDNIDKMVEYCHQGPPAANVERVEISAAKGIAPARFDVKPTV